MAAFAIPVLVAVIIGCCIRIRNMRMIILVFPREILLTFVLGKLRHLNTFLIDVKNGGTNRSSVLGDWMNRRNGFERLQQYSDGENDPLDDSNNNSSDEVITNTRKQQGIVLNKQNNTNTFKMNESL